MKFKRLPQWATLAALGFLVIAASSNHVVEGFRADRLLLEFFQEPKNPRAGATPQASVAPEVKAASNLVVSPFFRISQASAVSADRSARFAEAAYNPDDNEYLVVWQSDGLTEVRGVTDVYGQRINAATNQPSGISFRISNLSDANRDHSANHPQVVYNRTAREYLVVWHGSGLANSDDKFFEIYGQRLNRGGREIGGDFRISYLTDLGKVNTTFVRVTTQAQVAWNSTNNEYLVIWNGIGEPEDVVKKEIYGQRLKANGELLGKHFRISHTTDQGSNFHASAPAIAFNSRGNQYLVVWSGGFKKENQTEVWGQVLSATAELSSTNDFLISQVTSGRRYGSPHLDFNSDNNEYLVVFHANASPGAATSNLNEIFAQRIDPAKPGETQPNNIRVSNTEGAGNRASIPTVTYNGVNKEYLVIWRSVRANVPIEIWGQRISSSGTEIEADFQISNIAAAGKDRSVNNPSLTYNGTNGHYLIVWQGNPLAGATGAQINEIFGQQLAVARPQRQ